MAFSFLAVERRVLAVFLALDLSDCAVSRCRAATKAFGSTGTYSAAPLRIKRIVVPICRHISVSAVEPPNRSSSVSML
jgi:hypothetical protein